jgi:hypothetical protein
VQPHGPQFIDIHDTSTIQNGNNRPDCWILSLWNSTNSLERCGCSREMGATDIVLCTPTKHVRSNWVFTFSRIIGSFYSWSNIFKCTAGLTLWCLQQAALCKVSSLGESATIYLLAGTSFFLLDFKWDSLGLLAAHQHQATSSMLIRLGPRGTYASFPRLILRSVHQVIMPYLKLVWINKYISGKRNHPCIGGGKCEYHTRASTFVKAQLFVHL